MIVGGGEDLSFAGSDYLEVVHGKVAGRFPKPDVVEERVTQIFRGLVERGLIDTATTSRAGGDPCARRDGHFG